MKITCCHLVTLALSCKDNDKDKDKDNDKDKSQWRSLGNTCTCQQRLVEDAVCRKGRDSTKTKTNRKTVTKT